jgi:hypothetical protein
MDWLTFIATIVEATAWPLSVLAVFLVLRRHLVARLPDLESMEWKDFKFRFRQRVHEVAAEARQALPEPELGSLSPPSEVEQRLQLAELSPRAAILEAWIALEAAARTTLRKHGAAITEREIRQPTKLADALQDAGLLNPSQGEVLLQLRNLRNAAAHASEPKITVETAREFVRVAGAFERLIQARTPAA